ncbi:ABC transporter substrate-binding protein [Chromobacterium sp. IIBBL 290-4]|uniref:substrate-binding periplasmic protein n=1 Tax=Chromobacterium sp. IIBBL 290-4 TaxID=2953890 RepID=UPI0020B68382|nr:transporter substrate-binding domain-containing protein [Chromobacterium sp. IIBBL 290-4]UTH73885.1 transporter substrate-binding domain-containing protein [Chromobacterium sp. IIBBL 290-4]
MKWLLTCVLMLGPTLAQANPACPNGPLSVAYFDYGTAYHEGKGYDVETLHELAKRLDCPIQNEAEYPRIRVLKLLEIGQADIGASTTVTPERQRYLWMLPYHYTKNLVLLRKGMKVDTLDELLKLPDLRWGVVRGYRHGPAGDRMLEELTRQNKVVTAANDDDLYKMLCSGVITAIFAIPISYDPWMSSHPGCQQIEIHDLFPDSETSPGAIVLSRQRFSPQAAALWQAELRRMFKDGAIRAIMLRYYSASAVDKMLKSLGD